MSSDIFDLVEQAAERMGGSDPRWLKDRVDPSFTLHSEGDSGPNLLLLHGLLGAMSNWDSTFPLMAKFAKTTALHFPILTGHRSEVKVRALAAMTEFYIRKNNLAPVALCGNSLGGRRIIKKCLASPELVDCLILSGSSGLYEHSVDSLPVRPDEKFIRDHMKRVFVNEKFITDEAVQEVKSSISSRVNTLNLIHAARSAKRDNLLTELPKIQVPTLLLWGEDDQITTMDVAHEFHKHIPGSELRTIKKCGHAPMIEHPEWFAEQVREFLAKHSKQKTN